MDEASPQTAQANFTEPFGLPRPQVRLPGNKMVPLPFVLIQYPVHLGFFEHASLSLSTESSQTLVRSALKEPAHSWAQAYFTDPFGLPFFQVRIPGNKMVPLPFVPI